MLKIKIKKGPYLGSQRNYNLVKFESGKGWVLTYLVGVPITTCQTECQWPGPFSKGSGLLSKLLSLCHERCHAELWESPAMKIEDISKRFCDYSMALFNMSLPFHLMDMGTFPGRLLRVTHFVLPFLLKKQACTHRTDCNWKTDSAKQWRLTYGTAKLSLWEKPASLT